ncbi:MAG: DUF1570 domain-containing protein [Pirellulales bacterium]|nr:DUF1570 domain-containing protein [Pirellulales bacterium]
MPRPVTPGLPQHQILLDQLVVHTAEPLAADHRLLVELKDLGRDMNLRLGLAATSEPIHVHLFQHESAYQDFLRAYFPGFPYRRAFFLETDTRLAVYAYWGDRVAEDLRHEVAHGYLHAAVPNLPLWLDEGLAEYFEVARNQSGVNAPHVRELREALVTGRWKPDLVRMEQLTSASELSQRDYAEAWLWVHWMLHHADNVAGTADPRTAAKRTADNQPDKKIQVLQKYLARLKSSTEPVPPLSQILPGSAGDWNTQVLRHLQGMMEE